MILHLFIVFQSNNIFLFQAAISQGEAGEEVCPDIYDFELNKTSEILGMGRYDS